MSHRKVRGEYVCAGLLSGHVSHTFGTIKRGILHLCEDDTLPHRTNSSHINVYAAARRLRGIRLALFTWLRRIYEYNTCSGAQLMVIHKIMFLLIASRDTASAQLNKGRWWASLAVWPFGANYLTTRTWRAIAWLRSNEHMYANTCAVEVNMRVILFDVFVMIHLWWYELWF